MTAELVVRIKKIRANAVLGKKKHYNAADRKQKYQSRLGAAILFINILLGTGLVALLKSEVPDFMKWIGAVLAAIAALLTAFQTYFGFQKSIQGHRLMAGRYLEVAHFCANAIAAYTDGAINDMALAKRLDELTKLISKIDGDAHVYPPNQDDYEQAKVGIEKGEEDYTEEDLRLGD